MTPEEAREILEGTGAILSGHFLLTSGRHSDTYVEKARVFEHPDVVVRLGEEIASWYERVEAVVSPAVGAIPLGFAVALAADARFLYAERERGAMKLRRGFEVSGGERVLVVEDVVTTGGSVAEVHALITGSGAEALGVAAMVDRTPEKPAFPFRALLRIDARTFEPSHCPLCAAGDAPVAHGSRSLH